MLDNVTSWSTTPPPTSAVPARDTTAPAQPARRLVRVAAELEAIAAGPRGERAGRKAHSVFPFDIRVWARTGPGTVSFAGRPPDPNRTGP